MNNCLKKSGHPTYERKQEILNKCSKFTGMLLICLQWARFRQGIFPEFRNESEGGVSQTRKILSILFRYSFTRHSPRPVVSTGRVAFQFSARDPGGLVGRNGRRSRIWKMQGKRAARVDLVALLLVAFHRAPPATETINDGNVVQLAITGVFLC